VSAVSGERRPRPPRTRTARMVVMTRRRSRLFDPIILIQCLAYARLRRRCVTDGWENDLYSRYNYMWNLYVLTVFFFATHFSYYNSLICVPLSLTSHPPTGQIDSTIQLARHTRSGIPSH
jgi:hypothetical protein